MNAQRVIAQIGLVMLLVVCAKGQEIEQAMRGRASLYEPAIESAAARYQVDPHLLWTIAYLESRFRPKAISFKNGKPCAYGLMQFVPATARRYGLKDAYNVAQAVDAAARYVRDLQERFGGRGDLVLAAYNAGEGTVEAFRDGKRLVLSNGKVINPNALRTGGIPPYAETRAYVARGRTVYQSISRGKLIVASSNKSPGTLPSEAAEGEADSTDGKRGMSFYTFAPETKKKAIPVRISGNAATSLYAN